MLPDPKYQMPTSLLLVSLSVSDNSVANSLKTKKKSVQFEYQCLSICNLHWLLCSMGSFMGRQTAFFKRITASPLHFLSSLSLKFNDTVLLPSRTFPHHRPILFQVINANPREEENALGPTKLSAVCILLYCGLHIFRHFAKPENIMKFKITVHVTITNAVSIKRVKGWL